MRRLELRRHARRRAGADALSTEGRAQAQALGERSGVAYDRVFVSPAARAAETAAWILRGAGQQLPDHAVVPGLAGDDRTGGSAEGMAAGVRALLAQVPDGGRGLAVSHTPFVERAAAGLGAPIPPVAECEGILVTLRDDGAVEVLELRDVPATGGA
ncbi:MAG TPA: histidine phosphatase family protein [Actinomycetota bacterium]